MKGMAYMYLQNKKHLHFIGIGGSGMYPMAQILHEKGSYIMNSRDMCMIDHLI